MVFDAEPFPGFRHGGRRRRRVDPIRLPRRTSGARPAADRTVAVALATPAGAYDAATLRGSVRRPSPLRCDRRHWSLRTLPLLYRLTGRVWPARDTRALSQAVLNADVPFTPRVLLPLVVVLTIGGTAVLAR